MNWQVLGFGTTLALIDVIIMPIIKLVSAGKLSIWAMGIATILYATTPWIFLKALDVEGMGVMNVMWDLLSIVLVTLFGLVVMGEKVNTMKKIGLALSCLCVYLLCGSE
jgi:multidrug transporter EmrE-like cation transporter